MPKKQYLIYIMTNFSNTVLYTGITNNLLRRVQEHKSGNGGAFTKKYKATKLVYYESGDDVRAALKREKQLKGGSRQQKVELIKKMNPGWEDLYEKLD